MNIGETILVAEGAPELFGFTLCKKAQTVDAEQSATSFDELSGSSGPKLLLKECIVVFWTNKHTKILRKRVQDAGGRIEESVGPATTHVVVSDSFGSCQIHERLASEGLSTDCFSRWPAFIRSEYLSESIGQGRLLDDKYYRISISDPIPQPSSSGSPRLAGNRSRKRDLGDFLADDGSLEENADEDKNPVASQVQGVGGKPLEYM